MDWLKNINKNSPEFWRNYLTKFEKKSNRYVILCTDTSGLNPKKDVILSFGAIAVIDDSIRLGELFEVTIPQYKFLHDNGLSNDFLLESEQPKLSENQAIEKLIDFIGNSTLVGHRIHLDVEMINQALEKLSCGRLKNEALDVEIMHKKLNDINNANFTIDQLSAIYKIAKSENNSTTNEVFTTALIFLKLKSRLNLQ